MRTHLIARLAYGQPAQLSAVRQQRQENGTPDLSTTDLSLWGWTFRSIYLPSMSYSLPSTSFTRRELATIQSSR
jgi:hypothetical protein